ncbi:EF-hand domain-containing protein [Sphingomonas sp. ASV193]|uniref:EF-hand domain-containing protein n=1 Tax=Sphingomonas sp. ASV193 TaxID=3144405 RepID=UPI0032E87DBC
MSKLLLAGAVLAIAAPLPAQTAAPAPMAPMAQQGGGKSITRAEFIQRAVAAFQRADTNHDGIVTADELNALQAQGGGWKRAPGGGQWKRSEGAMANPNAAFDRLDTNHDGVLSRQEFAAGRQVRIEQRRIVMQNDPTQPGAQPMAGDMQAMHGMHHGGRGGMGGGAGMLRMADLNHDGRITLQEVQAVAAQHFDMMDTNHDGVLTPDERKANRGHMMPMDMKRGN